MRKHEHMPRIKSLNNENIKQEIDSELTFIFEIKLQTEHF